VRGHPRFNFLLTEIAHNIKRDPALFSRLGDLLRLAEDTVVVEDRYVPSPARAVVKKADEVI